MTKRREGRQAIVLFLVGSLFTLGVLFPDVAGYPPAERWTALLLPVVICGLASGLVALLARRRAQGCSWLLFATLFIVVALLLELLRAWLTDIF